MGAFGRRKSPWPAPEEMGDLVVSGESNDRVLLGRLCPDTVVAQLWQMFGSSRGTPALAAPRGYGVLVIGPARSGKTTSILIPSVVRWNGPVISTSIRNDVLKESWEEREKGGWPVLIYNPKDEGGFGTNTWSPLTACKGTRGWVGALRTATALIEAAAVADKGANREESFWNDAASEYLAPVLFAAAIDGPDIEPARRWLQDEAAARAEMTERLAGHPEAFQQAEAVWSLEPKFRDSMYLTARVALRAYRDPEVRASCLPRGDADVTDITPEAVLGADGQPGATLYILSPPTDWRYFAPLFSALITSIVEAAFERSQRDESAGQPLLLALDEVANIAPIKDLPSYSSMAAGAGIQLITVLQDLGQAERIWGKEGMRTLMTNHDGGRLILRGTVDTPTLEWVGEMLGEVDRKRKAKTRTGLFGKVSTTNSLERQPLATAAEIRTLDPGTALLISGSYPVARVSLKQWTTI
jgi:type IV secretion system protein VirD4